MKSKTIMQRAAPFGAVLLTLLTSCGHSSDSPAPTVPTTSYQGNVVLVDEFGNKVADRSGVTVSVVDQLTTMTTTDATGNFTLAVPQGTQRLNFTKAGYGTYLTAPTSISGSGFTAAKSVALGQTASTYLTYFRSWDYIFSGEYYRFMGRISANSTSAQVRYHRIFFATSKDVSPTNYKATSLFKGSFADPSGTPNWYWVTDSVSRATVTSINAGPYDKVYGVVYGDNPAADTYVDPASGRTIYPAVSKQSADVLEFNR